MKIINHKEVIMPAKISLKITDSIQNSMQYMLYSSKRRLITNINNIY